MHHGGLIVRYVLAYLVGFSIFVSATGPTLAQPSEQLQRKAPDVLDLVAATQQRGLVRIIVEFEPLMSTSEMRPESFQLNRVKAYVRETQDQILTANFGSREPGPIRGVGRALNRADISPMMALNVDANELEALAKDDRVIRLHHDRPEPISLLQTVPLLGMTGANGAYAAGATGAGHAIALLDTGIRAAHSFLAGKVIAEACFSTTDASVGATSLCRNGQPSDEGEGSGGECTGVAGCEHGTHVAGIAAGKNTAPGSPANGIAKDARLVSIKAVSKITGTGACSPAPSPCLQAFPMDQVKALDWIYQKAPLLPAKLAAVNMSLASGVPAFSFCDSDARKANIDKLSGIKVATVVGAGNGKRTNAVGAPACISTAVAVAASTKDDQIPDYSNMANMVSLIGPGGLLSGDARDILSSVPPNAFDYIAGTSMAAPHVSGAIAAMRSVCPTAEISNLVKWLQDTGHEIRDTRPGGFVSKRRIQVDAAVKAMLGTLQVSPAEDIAASGPNYGPFTPNLEYRLAGPSGCPQTYSITIENAPWLVASASRITLTAPTTISFSINPAALPLAPSVYFAAVKFANESDPTKSVTRVITLTVNGVGGALQGLGPLPGYSGTAAFDVSDDGLSVSGSSCVGRPCRTGQAVRWFFGYSDPIGYLPGDNWSIGYSMGSSAVVVGTSLTMSRGTDSLDRDPALVVSKRRAFLWLRGNIIPVATLPDHDVSEATGISNDSGAVVGYSWKSAENAVRAFRTIRGTAKQLRLPDGNVGETRAYGISADGSTIVGTSFAQAVRWTNDGDQIEELGFLSGHNSSLANAANANGAVVVGYSARSGGGGRQAFRYQGQMIGLGYLPGPNPDSVAVAVNSTGNVVVGTSNGTAFRWTMGGQMRAIADLLAELGQDVSRWNFNSARGISADGTIIVGDGSYRVSDDISMQVGWVARIPLPVGAVADRPARAP